MKNITRRNFLKTAGIGTVALGAAVACGRGEASKSVEPEGAEQMPMRKNPISGDMVSLLGYGCMRWPMIQDANGQEVIDQDAVNEMVAYAMEHGINYFDSAPAYLQGQSERATAIALKRYPRESYYIATKMSMQRIELNYDAAVKMYRTSLERFETDYIDYYLLHSCSDYKKFKAQYLDTGVLEFILQERIAGRIRHLGFSFHGPKSGFDELLALHDTYHWDFVQIQMNYVDWNHADAGEADASYLYEKLAERGIPVIIMEPLLGGQLSDVPKVVADRMKEREPSKSIASWAFRFCGSYPNVMCVLSGMTYMEHLKDNLDTYLHFKPLKEEENEFLEDMAGLIKNFPLVSCTGCQYCMPCPYGINIPGIFKHYNSCINDGFVAESSAQKDFKKLKKKYLTSYDRAIESVRQADHCINCGQCVPRCPQHINIPTTLRRIDNYIEKLKQETL